MKNLVKYIIVALLFSCNNVKMNSPVFEKEKKEDISVSINRIILIKLVEWSGIPSSIKIELLFKNNTGKEVNLNFFDKSRNCRENLKIKGNDLEYTLRPITISENISLNPKDSIKLPFRIQYEIVNGNSLYEMFKSPKNLISEDFEVILKDVFFQKDRVVMEKPKDLKYTFYLDDKIIKIKDSINMNYTTNLELPR